MTLPSVAVLFAATVLVALASPSPSLSTTERLPGHAKATKDLPSHLRTGPSVIKAKPVVGKGGGADCATNDNDMYCGFMVGLDSSLCAMGGSIGDFMMTFCPGSCGACDVGNGVCVMDDDARMASVARAFGYGFVSNCDQAVATHQNAFGTEGCDGPFSSVLKQHCPCACYEEPDEVPCAPPRVGIQYNLSRSDASLGGFVETLNIPFSFEDPTMLYEPASGECVFVGALPSINSTVFALGAFGRRSAVFNVTNSTTIAETFHNDVYFYNHMVDGSGSFGFAAVPEIFLSVADTGVTVPESRLSWHYVGGGVFGGYRTGSVINLNSNDVWRKVVLTGPCSCSPVPAGVLFNYPLASDTLSGFTTTLDIAYDENLPDVKYEPAAALAGNCVFIGAKETAASTNFYMGAFGRRDTVFATQNQNSIAENLSNGVYFYNYNGGSFGFAATPDVTLNSADVRSEPNPESRLSWHQHANNIGPSSGYRAGENFLNGNAEWRKVVMVGNCDL